eukprot:5163642-Prymnesium_polylepis.1
MLTCVRTGFYGRTVPSAKGTLESSPAAVRSVKRRRATKASSRGRSSSSTDAMSEASARRRRAELQWICVVGVRQHMFTARVASEPGGR